jgi:hypothetical protein
VRECFRLPVVLWTTDAKPILEIQGSPAIEAVLLTSQDLSPAADAELRYTFEQVCGLLFRPLVFGVLSSL